MVIKPLEPIIISPISTFSPAIRGRRCCGTCFDLDFDFNFGLCFCCGFSFGLSFGEPMLASMRFSTRRELLRSMSYVATLLLSNPAASENKGRSSSPASPCAPPSASCAPVARPSDAEFPPANATESQKDFVRLTFITQKNPSENMYIYHEWRVNNQRKGKNNDNFF